MPHWSSLVQFCFDSVILYCRFSSSVAIKSDTIPVSFESRSLSEQQTNEPMRMEAQDRGGGIRPCATLTLNPLAFGLSIIHSCMLHHFE